MADQSNRFKDKVIFITGGTSGIGLTAAMLFALEGAAKVIVSGRRVSKWEAAKDYLQKNLSPTQLSNILFWPCDVRVEEQVKNTIEKIFVEFGRLDVCFNNAGVQPGIIDSPDSGLITGIQFESKIASDGSILYRIPAPQPDSDASHSKDAIDKTQRTEASPFCESEIATSCLGVSYSLKWELHYILEKNPKNLPVSIINTASRNGILPDARRHLYAASKAFIISITKSVANQMAQKVFREKRGNIRVNVISPGPADTPLEYAAYNLKNPEDKLAYEKYVTAAATGVPMQRTAQPEEIAQSVLFLADERMSSYITAANLPVDGGHTGSPFLR